MGQIIDERLLKTPLDTKWFDRILNKSMRYFTDKKYKAIWLQLSSPNHLHLIPYVSEYGFYPHHCQTHYIMFVKWMDDSQPNQLPVYLQHAIGVGAVLINSKNQILMVQENSGPSSKYKIWKLPGGLVDANELLSEAVVRELKEDTGVDAKFKTLCTALEMMPNVNRKNTIIINYTNSFYVNNPARGSNSRDIYCMCLCEIVGNEEDVTLVKQASEIADLQWFDIESVFKMPLWKINGKRQSTSVWSAGLKTCVDIHNGKRKGFGHQFLPFAFNKGKASIYRCNL